MEKDREKVKRAAAEFSDEELDEMLEKAEEEQRQAGIKRKNKKNRQDILTVLMIFAVFILAIFVISWITRNPEAIKKTSGGSMSLKEYEEAKKTGRIIVTAVGAAALAVVGLFVRSMIRRKRKAERIIYEEQQKLLEIEAARARVNKARMAEKAYTSMSEKDKRRAMRRYSLDDMQDDGIDWEKYAMGMGEKKGRRLGEYDIEREYTAGTGMKKNGKSFIEKIKDFLKKMFRRKDT